MTIIDSLLDRIETYCLTVPMAATTFGRLAVNDGKFVGRLRAGKGVTVEVLLRAGRYMDENPPPTSPPPTSPAGGGGQGGGGPGLSQGRSS